MINLLDTKDKEWVAAESRGRYRIVNEYLLALLLLIALAAAGAFYSSLLIENRSLTEKQAALEKGAGHEEASGYANDLKAANELLAKMAADKSGLRAVSPLFDTLISLRPAGIRLNTIALDKADGKLWQIKLAGRSSRRSDLLEYVEDLKGSGLFKTVDSPFSNLIKEGDSDFALTLVPDKI
jgi:hypothetical protein